MLDIKSYTALRIIYKRHLKEIKQNCKSDSELYLFYKLYIIGIESELEILELTKNKDHIPKT